jgi:hypothetical protein
MYDDELSGTEQMVLSDLINRVLDKGVVITGHVLISIADIDLIELDLRLVLTSVESATRRLAKHAAESQSPSNDADVPLLPGHERGDGRR